MPSDVEAYDAPLRLVPHRAAVLTHPPDLPAFGDDAELTDVRLPGHELAQPLDDEGHVVGVDKIRPALGIVDPLLKGEAGDVAEGFGDPFEQVGAVGFDAGGVRVV